MKFAQVDGGRREAEPKLAGACPGCGKPMVARCGTVRMWHWTHAGGNACDHWWEKETPWHRAWKSQFPVKWQEVIQTAEDGQKHIADVKTDQGFVLEFQNSHLEPDERLARDNFYHPKLCWVVNGLKRKRDAEQFLRVFNGGSPVGRNTLIRRIFSNESVLLREWGDCNAPVFFDFGEPSRLWWLLPKSHTGRVYVAAFSRLEFIELHRGGATPGAQNFADFVRDSRKLIS